MRECSRGQLARHVEVLRGQFGQAGELPLANLLPRDVIVDLLNQVAKEFRNRIYTPILTLLLFMWQALNPDPSCRGAVARFIAHREARGERRCSSHTGAYCKARGRLPEAVLAELVQETGRRLHDEVPGDGLLQGRDIKIFDGSTVTMPDTPENQAEYPQHSRQKKGLGFPIARLGVLFSLASGAVLEMATCRFAGKGQSELGMLAGMRHRFRRGDILLTDRYLCSFAEVALLLSMGVDVVARLHHGRKADFRRGRRLGRGDHVVIWYKPRQRPAWMDEKTFAALPATIVMRELRVEVSHAGCRTRSLVVATTLIDPDVYPAHELAEAYRRRWFAELDLRSLKQTLQMDMLRTHTPSMVRKEIWVHLLVYNLVRALMGRAGQAAGIPPREISFKGALQLLLAFQPQLLIADPTTARRYLDCLLAAIVQHRVGDRPHRVEPRAVKRRPKHYPRLQVPRAKARLQLMKRVAA